MLDITYNEKNENSFINNDKDTSIKGNFINDYLNSFQNAIYDYFDSESLDSVNDKTIVAELNETLKEATPKFSKRKVSPTKQRSPSSAKRTSKTNGETTPKKGNKYSNRHRFKEHQVLF